MQRQEDRSPRGGEREMMKMKMKRKAKMMNSRRQLQKR